MRPPSNYDDDGRTFADGAVCDSHSVARRAVTDLLMERR